MQVRVMTAAVSRDDDLSVGDLTWGDDAHAWEDAKRSLLEAVDSSLRPAVERLLSRPRFGGAGIRAWTERVAAGATVCPEHIPDAVVRVYLEHSEAMPHHDCGGCGMAVPVIPSRHDGDETPDRVFFSACPCCGDRTGPYLFWATNRLRAAKPR